MRVRQVPEVGRSAKAEEAAQILLDSGALVIRGAAAKSKLEQVDHDLAPYFAEVPFSVGRFYGDRTVRFGRLFSRSDALWPLAIDPLLYGITSTVLGKWHRAHSISFAQAIAVHPGAPIQVPHRDGDMWPVGAINSEHLVSVMWPLTHFNDRTGATRIWLNGPEDDSSQPGLAPGDALVFLGSTIHGAGANISTEIRRGVVIGYTAAWLLPAENPVLANPPEVARTMPRQLAELLGYRRFAPNLNNFDCRCPSEILQDLTGRGAVDELHPEQVAGLEQFYSGLEHSNYNIACDKTESREC